jgi:putative transposase
LFAVIMEAYLHGTSTRKVDDLVRALGADSGIAKSEVSWICAELGRSGGVPGPQPGRAAVSVHVLGRARRPQPRSRLAAGHPSGLGLDPGENAATLLQAQDPITFTAGVDSGSLPGHFLRNVLTQVPKAHADRVAAAIRTIFAQPDAATGARTSCPALPRSGGSPRSGDDQSPAWWQT